MKTVLFACVHNAGRSQMAAAFFNHAVDPARARALLASTTPAGRLHPEAVARVREIRDEIRDRVEQLIVREGWWNRSSPRSARRE